MSPASIWSLWDFSTKKKEREKERKREGEREKAEGISIHFVSEERSDGDVEREGKKKKERGVQGQSFLTVKDPRSALSFHERLCEKL